MTWNLGRHARLPGVMSDQRWHLRAVPLPDGDEPVDWWVSEGRLTSSPVPGASDLPGGWVAPGLVDAHVHLTFEARPRLGLDRGRELVDAHLALQRRAGVLVVRDAGSVPDAPPLPDGVIGCGPFLAPPDFFLPHLYEGTPPAEAVEAARERVRAGWSWVKVIADYPADGNPFAAALGYPFDLLRRIADAVHDEGGRLAAHVMGPIVREVVEAGVDSIEHGNWADERTVEEMAARGTAWTPTLTTVMGHVVPLQDRLPAARELIAPAPDAAAGSRSRRRAARRDGRGAARQPRRRGRGARGFRRARVRCGGSGEHRRTRLPRPPRAGGGRAGRPRHVRPRSAHGRHRARLPRRGARARPNAGLLATQAALEARLAEYGGARI